MDNVRKYLKTRFQNGGTIPGTRSYHHYIPISSTKISFKTTSEDINFAGSTPISKTIKEHVPTQNELCKFKLMDVVACKYDSFWWIGTIEKIDKENSDLMVKFMHPHGPSKKFSWPNRDDCCWVPFNNILININVPTTRSGRMYEISDTDYVKIVNKY